MELFKIIFWIGALGIWFLVLLHGIVWIEKHVDNFLDRRFGRAEESDKNRHAWPDYLDKD